MIETKCPLCGMGLMVHGATCTAGGSFAGPSGSALHGATYQELDDANAALSAEVAAVQTLARSLMRTCFEEGNRLANHCSDGAARWAMQNLYNAANEAKKHLLPNDKRSDRRP